MNFICRLIAVILLPIACYSGEFDLSREFPNFLGEGVDFNNPKSVGQRINLIEKNLQTLLNRIQLPHIEHNELKSDLFFNHFYSHLQNMLPEAEPGKQQHELRLYISGGVVRTMLAFIYKYVYEQKRLCSDKVSNKDAFKAGCTTEFILEKMHKESSDKLTAAFVLGVGSDLDILYTLTPNDKNIEEKIEKGAFDFINSAETYFNLRNFNNPIKKSLVPVGDVKEYTKQISRTLEQGGSLLDTLAFEIKFLERPQQETLKNSYSYAPTITAKLLAPKGYERVLSDLLKGIYEYIVGNIKPEPKQAIRGTRALLELPFLQIKDETQIINELIEILKESSIDHKAIEQIEKMVRNSYYHGANNRAYRSSKDSAIGLVLQIAQKHSEDKQCLLPEFAQPVSKTRKIDENLISGKLLPYIVSNENFKQQHTNNGVVLHGTSIVNALSILRNGFVMSNDRQGRALFGPGIYTTPDENEAKSYGEFIIPLSIKKRIGRILNWAQMKPSLQSIFKDEAIQRKFSDVFEMLKIDFGVDVIINTHIIILNPAVLKYPKDLRVYLQALTRIKPNFADADDDIDRFWIQLARYSNLLFLRKFYEGENEANDFARFILENLEQAEHIILKSQTEYCPSSLLCLIYSTLPFEKLFTLHTKIRDTFDIEKYLALQIKNISKQDLIALFPKIIKSRLMKNFAFDKAISEATKILSPDEVRKFIVPHAVNCSTFSGFAKFLSKYINNHMSLEEIIELVIPSSSSLHFEKVRCSGALLKRIDILDFAELVGEAEKHKKRIPFFESCLQKCKSIELASLINSPWKLDMVLSYQSEMANKIIRFGLIKAINECKVEFWQSENDVLDLISFLKQRNLFADLKLLIKNQVKQVTNIIKNVPEFLYEDLDLRYYGLNRNGMKQYIADLLILEKMLDIQPGLNLDINALFAKIATKVKGLDYDDLKRLTISFDKADAGCEGKKLIAEIHKTEQENYQKREELKRQAEAQDQLALQFSMKAAAWEEKILNGRDFDSLNLDDSYEHAWLELARQSLSPEEFSAWQEFNNQYEAFSSAYSGFLF